jgi:CheY-like chemotaxis protein
VHFSCFMTAGKIEPTGPAGRARRAVVYVEDNPRNVALMADLISELPDVELLTAPNAELGLELIRARCPSLVLMDIHLPGINGFEAMRRLRASPETCHIPVIALSAAGRVQEAKLVASSGFHSYFDKPVDVGALLQTLQTLLQDS